MVLNALIFSDDFAGRYMRNDDGNIGKSQKLLLTALIMVTVLIVISFA